MSTINASAPRKTRYEVRFLHQGPNSFGLECAERGVFGSSPVRLEVHESRFTDEQMTKIHEALEILENAFAEEHDEKEKELGALGLDAPRAMVHALVRQAEDAKREARAAALERARIEAETIVMVAERDELDRNLAVMREAASKA